MPRKKLNEIALLPDAINKASTKEKSIQHGQPSTLCLWWVRRPFKRHADSAVAGGCVVPSPTACVVAA